MKQVRSFAGPFVIGGLVLGLIGTRFGWISSAQFDAIFAVAMAFTYWSLLIKVGLTESRAAICSLSGLFLALGAQMVWPQIVFSPYLAIFAINLGAGVLFARGLMPGRVPLLLQIIEVMDRRSTDDPAFRRFVKHQSLLWAAVGVVSGVAGLIGMIWPGSRGLVDPLLFGSIVFQIVWFVVSHYYASWRYQRPETWYLTMRTMSRPHTWERLEP